MKKIVIVLSLAAFTASPAWCQTKSKKPMTKEEVEAAQIAQQNDNTRRALRDSLPLILPSWAVPIFFTLKLDEKLKEGDKKPDEKKITKKTAEKNKSP